MSTRSDFPRGRRPGFRLPKGRAALIAIALILFASISTIVGFYTELLWYREVGFSSVYLGILKSKFGMAAVFGVPFFIFLALNLLIAGRHRRPAQDIGRSDPLERYRITFSKYFRLIAIGGSAVLAFFFAAGLTSQWQRLLLYSNAVDFNKQDPLFGKDIGFYVFKLPLYQLAYSWIFTGLVTTLLLSAGAHVLSGNIIPQMRLRGVVSFTKAHLSVMVALIAALKAWGYRLDQYNLLFSTRGQVSGASYTDVNAELPVLKLLVIVALLVAALLIINIRLKGWTLPAVGIGLLLLVSILGSGLYPALVQRFSVEPAQFQKEKPFLEKDIKATRDAFGLSAIKVTQYPVEPGLTQQTADANAQTIRNIRLFSPPILQRSYSSLQEIRPYYTFQDVDVDRYTIEGAKRQVMLSVRELATANIPSPNWQNSHLVFTHGYGAVVSPTNEATPSGAPKFLVQDIPPVSTTSALKIEEGGIYFGESITDYSVVNTDQKELDFSRQETNELTNYKGDGGVVLSGGLRRLAYALRFRNMNLLISGLINPDSKIIYNREIKERLHKSAPFLEFDGDPYPVVIGGRIVWMADGYTKTSMYPYSRRIDLSERTFTRGQISMTGRNNYLRNSVKATIDAYDGTVTLYQWDTSDPLIKAWRKAFPKLFKDSSEMPAELREHVRYPEDLFRIQAGLYRLYHATDPAIFFQAEDLWEIPKDPNLGGGQALNQSEEIQPYYVLTKLPGTDKEQYALILPMNPRGKLTMVAYLAADSGPDGYGSMVDFRFQRTLQINGVSQFHSGFQQIPSIAREITLLSQRGSKIAYGNVLVIPLGQTLLYVQPLFIEAEGNALPELKFVIVSDQNKTAIGVTLPEALKVLLEGGTISAPSGEGPSGATDVASLVRSARAHFEAADSAARRGDWAEYGRELAAAKADLEAAEKLSSP